MVQRALVLKKDDLSEVLAAGLKSDAELLHGRITDELSMNVHVSLAVRAAHDKAPLANVRKHGVGIAVFKKCGALARILEQRNRVLILARVRNAGRQENRCEKSHLTDSLHISTPRRHDRPLLRITTSVSPLQSHR